MLGKSLDLQVKALGDIDIQLWVCTVPEQDGSDFVWFETFLNMFTEMERVSGIREAGI
tara:strand:+ start:698 stop:871 length:174 start_codon:yes stop_codon:yes gene_type:complete